MTGDQILFLVVALFYLFRFVSKRGKKGQAASRQVSSRPVPSGQVLDGTAPEQNPQRSTGPIPLHFESEEESDSDPIAVQPPAVEPSLARLLGQLLGDPEEPVSQQERPDSAWQTEEGFESAAPVGSSDDRFNPAADNEWHTESRNDWSDQDTDFGFHATLEKQRTDHGDHRERSFVQRSTELPTQSGGFSWQQSSAQAIRPYSTAPVNRSSRISGLLSGKTNLENAMMLQLVLGPPVSLQTRSVRRRLS